MSVERYLCAKELATALTEIGLRTHDDYAREIIRSSPLSVRRCLRLSEAIEFLRANPRFSPFSRKEKAARRNRARHRSESVGIRKL